MISCSNITKKFSQQTVLDSLSCHFQENGLYLLLGESGSGKTTFLNILSGFVPFESGSIAWNGTIFNGRVDTACIEEDFDYITQDSYFVNFISAMDNMRLVCEEDQKILEMLEHFGLQGVVRQLPETLSGGERQRLAIVRALLKGKRVLFLDEPTAALDEKNKLAVFQMLAELKDQVLIICATHDTQAEEYADAVLRFSKIGSVAEVLDAENIPAESLPENSLENQESKNEDKKGLWLKNSSTKLHKSKEKKMNAFLKQWFVSKQRNRWAMVFFTFFLVLALGLCIFSDFPERKLESSVEYMYGINMFTLTIYGKEQWEDIVPDTKKLQEVVLSYTGSCPDGNEDLDNSVLLRPVPDYELTLNTLPFQKEVFRLSDKIKYGTYFTEAEQIILSWEMANTLYPGNPEKLIGKHVSRKIYGLGDVDLEIVGIFDCFDDTERTYLEAMGINMYSGGEYDPSYYTDLYFVNSELVKKLEDDTGFYRSSTGGRTYVFFFDSYREMKKYYNRYQDSLNVFGSSQAEYSTINISLYYAFSRLFDITLPLGICMVIFATLFYAALKKTEYVYSCQFISVFEYAGYPKEKVINRFILLNILELIKSYVIALGFALLITGAINWVNRKYLFVNFQIFTVNLPMIAGFLTFMVLLTLIYVNFLFRRVKVTSWYENLIARRDLI